MARLFGTDGVRGVANSELTPELAYRLGRVHGSFLHERKSHPRVAIGRDTRLSGQLLEASYAAGLCASGADAVILGVIPTPGVAWLLSKIAVDGGCVVSASHNPYRDNGLKLLNYIGYKLSDENEDELEALMGRVDSLPRPIGGEVGQIQLFGREAENMYVDYLIGLAEHDLKGMKIVLDCANGAASSVAPRVFTKLGAELVVLHNNPTGTNINLDCGSTHPESLQEAVVKHKAHLGLAFDGDADRCLACDENGQMIDGDHMLLIFGKWLREKDRLPGNNVVTTVMANLGLQEALDKEGLNMLRTAVGDRYVLAEMRKLGAAIGGEQSGHIIFSEFATTGDGVLTGLMLSQILCEKQVPLSELAKEMQKKPQYLVNVKVKDKHNWDAHPKVAKVVAEVEEKLTGRGRLLVRPSGTESLVRVMAEGPDAAELQNLVNAIKEALLAYCPLD